MMEPKDFDRLQESLSGYLDLLTEEKLRSLNPQTSQKQSWLQYFTIDRTAKTLGIVTTILGIFGAIFVFLYSELEKTRLRQEELAQTRREAIAKFAIDLSSPKKRTSAAFAVATLGEDEALPLLMHHLSDALSAQQRADLALQVSFWSLAGRESPSDESRRPLRLEDVLSPRDLANIDRKPESWREVRVTQREGEDLAAKADLKRDAKQFVRALVLSIAGLPSEAGIGELVRLNRSAASPARPAGKEIIFDATSAAIWAYATGPGAVRNVPLDGVHLKNIEFSSDRSVNARLERMKLTGLNACRPYLVSASLSGSTINKFFIGSGFAREANFSETRLSKAKFTDTELVRASFERSLLRDVAFEDSELSSASFRAAKLIDVRFDNVDLSGADFTKATFGDAPTLEPGQPVPDGYQTVSFNPDYFVGDWMRGPVVRNANFAQAQGLHDHDREYLCRFGALNVPAGCEGIAPEPDDQIRESEAARGWARSCF